MTRPVEYALSLYRGDSYTWRFDFWEDEEKTVPVDFGSASAEAEVRNREAGDVVMTMTCTIEDNMITVVLAADDWLDWTAGRAGVWDLQVTYSGGEVITYVAGPVEIDGDVVDSEALASGSGAALSRVN